jgi:asparagine synthase (glutamine-hydrolysing)
MPWELEPLMGRDAAADGLARLRPLEHVEACLEPDPGTPYGRVSTLEASLYMRNQLLRDTDWASMDHSLEIRVPLVDATLLDRLAPLLVHRGGLRDKTLLARSPSTPLAADVVRRPKTGFALPLQAWISRLTGELDEWRSVPALAKPNCHWSRRLAYAIAVRAGAV